MTLQAIKKQPAEYLAAEYLRKQITTGEILPGTRLTETLLAEQLAISRGTLRIALHQLAREGLIVQTPYTGWASASIAPEDLWELYTLRAALESMAARLVCEQLDEKGIRELNATYDELVRACDHEKYHLIAEKDFMFHKKIVELAKNRRLVEHYRLVEQQIRIFVASTYNCVTEPATVIEHHAPFLKALLDRDVDTSERLLREHAVSEGRKLYYHLTSQVDAEPDN